MWLNCGQVIPDVADDYAGISSTSPACHMQVILIDGVVRCVHYSLTGFVITVTVTLVCREVNFRNVSSLLVYRKMCYCQRR